MKYFIVTLPMALLPSKATSQQPTKIGMIICNQKHLVIPEANSSSRKFCIFGKMNGKHKYQKNSVHIVQAG